MHATPPGGAGGVIVTLRSASRAAMGLGLVAVVVTSSGCGGVLFKEDKRLEIVSPDERADVTLPLTVAWTIQDFRVARPGIPGGSFLLVVDRSPQRPGDGLDAFVRDDDECRGPNLQFCLRPEYLAERGIYQTTDTKLTLANIPIRVGVSEEQKDRHEVTITLLDEARQRISEAAWEVTFKVVG